MASSKDKLMAPIVIPPQMPHEKRSPLLLDMATRSWGSGKHMNRDYDVAKGRRRNPKHKKRDEGREAEASAERVAARYARRYK